MKPLQAIKDNYEYLLKLQADHKGLDLPPGLLQELRQATAMIEDRLGQAGVSLALVGGFSAGKSTLINAILGEQFLTSRINPTTICPTYIVYNDAPALSVILNNGQEAKGRELTTPPVREVALEAGGEKRKLQPVGFGIYHTSVEFEEAGSHSISILLNGKRNLEKTVIVPKHNFEVQFYYSALTHTIQASSEGGFWTPDVRAPELHILGVESKHQVTLQSPFLNNQFSGLCRLPPGQYTFELSFDWAWFRRNYRRWRPRPLQTIFQRLLARIWPTYRLELVRINPNLNQLRAASLKVEYPTTFYFQMDLETGRLKVADASLAVVPFKRTFSLTTARDRDAAAEILAHFTAEDGGYRHRSGLLQQVVLGYPSAILKNDLTIVDTPGIAAEDEHTAITEDVVKNKADACLFLCPADQAGTMSDFGFITGHAQEFSGEIFFGVTKVDIAEDPAELEEVLALINEKIKSRAGISHPQIFPFSALSALREPNSDEGRKFRDLIQRLIEIMIGNRERIMANRLLRVEKAIIGQLRSNAKNKLADYSERLQELREYVIEDLASFVKVQGKLVHEQLGQRYDTDRYIDMFSIEMHQVLTRELRNIQVEIYGAADFNKLRYACENNIGTIIENLNAGLGAAYNRVTERFNAELLWLIQGVFAEFEESFERQYPLKKITDYSFTVEESALTRRIDDLAVKGVVGDLSDAAAQGVIDKAVGAGAGAFLGSLFFPGIGTIIGGIAGFLFGGLFGPNLDEMKKKAYDTISVSARDHFADSIMAHVTEMVQDRKHDVAQIAIDIIKAYLRKYEQMVANLIEEHEQKKVEIERSVQLTEKIAAQLHVRRAGLEELIASISNAYAQGATGSTA